MGIRGVAHATLHTGCGPDFKLKHQLQTGSLFGNVLHLTNGLQNCAKLSVPLLLLESLSTPSPVSKRQKYHYVAVESLRLQVCVSSNSLLGNIGTAIIFCLFHQQPFCFFFFFLSNCSGVRRRCHLSNELLFQFAFKRACCRAAERLHFEEIDKALSEHDGFFETLKSFEFLCFVMLYLELRSQI